MITSTIGKVKGRANNDISAGEKKINKRANKTNSMLCLLFIFFLSLQNPKCYEISKIRTEVRITKKHRRKHLVQYIWLNFTEQELKNDSPGC